MSELEMTAKGYCGQIELYNNKICIRRKGFFSFLQHGLKGDKNIMISSITSIQFKAAGLTNGYIQIAFSGGKEAKGGIFQAGKDENTVMFTKRQQPLFEKIKDAVESRLQSGKGISASPGSDADELAKLADLRDKGILTEDEFQHKKKQILGM